MFKKIINGRTSRLQFYLLLFIPMFLLLIYLSDDELYLLYFFVWLAYAFLLTVRRLHDFGIAMKDSMGVKMRTLLFEKGDSYENKYGKPPRL